MDTAPVWYADFAYTRPSIKGSAFFKEVRKTMKGQKPSWRNVRTAAFDLLEKSKTHREQYSKECGQAVWRHITMMDNLNKHRRHLYVFDLTDCLLGLPFGAQFATSELRSAMTALGARRKSIPHFGVWKHEINDFLILNIIKPMWDQTVGYTALPAVILDNQSPTELHAVSNNYWIVKADDDQLLDGCRAFGLRCMPHYRAVTQYAKKLPDVKEQPDYKRWVQDCWHWRGAPLWFSTSEDKVLPERLSTVTPTIRFM